jgi:hypothetical protein
MHCRNYLQRAVDLGSNGGVAMSEKAINAVALLIMICLIPLL